MNPSRNRVRSIVFAVCCAASFVVLPCFAQEASPAPPDADAPAYLWLALGAIAILAAWCAGAWRWKLILDASGLRFRYGYLLRTWVAADFFTTPLPALFSIPPFGAAYRFAVIARASRETVGTAAALVVEKLYGFVSSAVLFAVAVPLALYALPIGFVRFRLFVAVLGLLIVAGIVLLALLRPRITWLLASTLFSPKKERPILLAWLRSFSVFDGEPIRALYITLTGIVYQGLRLAASVCLVFSVSSALAVTRSELLRIVLSAFRPLSEALIIETTATTPLNLNLPGPASFSGESIVSGHPLARSVLLLVCFAFVALQLYRIAAKRSEAVTIGDGAHTGGAYAMDLDAVRAHRLYLVMLTAGALGGGLLAGAVSGLSEGLWIANRITQSNELRLLWWGPLFYGLLISPLGVGVGWLFALLTQSFNRFPKVSSISALSFGGVLAVCIVIFGRFRYARDVLGEGALNSREITTLLAFALASGIATAVAGMLLSRRLSASWKPAVVGVFAAYAAIVTGGAALGALWHETPEMRLPPPPANPAAPNVILIVADTLRADYLSLYSPEATAQTPALSAFREDAILFENFFAHAPWTKPTFASIFTGLYPTEHGAVLKASNLSPNVETIAERLFDQGYYTQGFPNNPNITPSFGFGRGFVSYEHLEPRFPFWGTRSAGRLALYQVIRRLRSRLILPRIEVDTHYRPAAGVNTVVEEWVDRVAPEHAPFFLFFHYMEPHDPYMIDETSGRGFAQMNLGLTPDFQTYGVDMVNAYRTEIERLDRYLGLMFDHFKQRGIYDNSLIVFVSDHGEEFHDHGGWWHGLTHYDEMLRVPMVLKMPGNKRGGETNTGYARQIDLAPTFLSVLGLAPSEAMSGEALVDADGVFLNGGIAESYAESDFVGAQIRSIRRADLKFIRARPGKLRKLEPEELYDLANDPAEQENLAGRGNPVEADLRALLESTQSGLKRPPNP